MEILIRREVPGGTRMDLADSSRVVMPQDGDGLVSYPLKAVLEGPQATREEGDGQTIVVPVARIVDMRTVPDGYEPRHRD